MARSTRRIEGRITAKGLKIALVASRFNAFIVERLVDGGLDAFRRTGGDDADATVIWVPGAFEIPQAARRAVDSGEYDAVVCLGCVIRGATPHFDYVAGECAKGIGQIALSSDVPVSFGVLTTDTIEQAIERAGTKAGNKGFDAVMAALEMASVFEEIKPSQKGRRKK